jgi:UDP-N-acetylmuramoylalanine--D-glutamate ligase
MANMPGRTNDITFGPGGTADVVEGMLVVGGIEVCRVEDLARSLPHDIANALAAAATAMVAGADPDAVGTVLRSFTGLEHRVEFVAELDDVRWFNDSKATTPHAVIAGVGGFESAVLIAGGRNKGVDLAPLRSVAPPVHAVVAIGEAADEVVAVFDGVIDVVKASSMHEAVATARSLALPGDAVVLSPACTSYDWYADYGARGRDFARLVRELDSAGRDKQSNKAGCR